MRRVVKAALSVLAGMLLLVGCLHGVDAVTPNASWTVMVYLDGDNNLDPDAHADMDEMAAVGSTSAVNVLVLLDEFDGPANLLRVTAGGSEVVSGFPLNGKEANMGDGRTLATFVDFVTANAPADHYLLDLWDHGDDFRGFAWDDHPNPDNSPGDDFMTHDEIVGALAGHHFDILAFDGCVMSNLEVSYEYVARGLSIDYLVASEIYIPNQGFAYDTLLAPLVAEPSMDSPTLAKTIVDSYMAYYTKGGWQVGLTVLKMSAVPGLVSALGILTQAIRPEMPTYRGCIAAARGNAHLGWSMSGWEAFIDFPTWLSRLQRCVGAGSVLTPAFAAVGEEMASTIAYLRNTHALDVKGAGGIGIFFPGSAGSFEHNGFWHSNYFLMTEFSSRGWYAFLQAYWNSG